MKNTMFKTIKVISAAFLLVSVISIGTFTHNVHAQEDDGVEIPVDEGFIKEIFGGNISLNIFKPTKYWEGDAGFWSIIGAIFSLAFPLLFIAFLFAIGVGGIRWLSSQGNEGKLQSAQKWIQNAVFGFVATALAFILLNVITWFMGFGNVFGLAQNLSTCGNKPLYQFKKENTGECTNYQCNSGADGHQTGWACIL